MSPSTSSNPPLIRDAALRLFAEPGGARASVRDIATAAGVSPALVIRHFGSMEGLREAVDAHVATQIGALLEHIASDPAGAIDPHSSASFADAATRLFGDDSPLPRYLLRSLVDGGDRGAALVELITRSSVEAWQSMIDAGAVSPGPDPRARAALVAMIDLAALALREPLGALLGADPLTGEGAERWTAEVARMLARTSPHGASAGSEHEGNPDD